jgi:exopolysaccharide production protein ExoZ
MFACLQGGRAVAAILVILYHNSLYIFAKEKYWGHDPAEGLFNFTHAGVKFFFVLSGFIILHIHWKDIGRPSEFAAFVKKRFLRIYPMYWLILAIIVPVYFLVPSFGFDYHRDAVNIFSSVLLIYLNEERISELPVAWTLHHEVLFYFMFSLAILHKRFGYGVFALWFIASAASMCMEPFAFPLVFIASPLHVLFLMGMAACWFVRRGRIAAPGVFAAAGVMLFVAAGMEENFVWILSADMLNLLYGLGSAFALVGLVELERQQRLRVPAFLQLIGDASYSIYLTHFTVLSLLAKVFIKLGAREMLPAMVSYVLLLVLVTLIGIVVHLLVEKPILKALNRAFIPKRALVAQTV